MSVRAIKEGAVDFLAKPFRDQDLLDAIQHAPEIDRVSGLLNKQIAGELGSSEVTVKMHRGQVMRKMKAQSLVQLIRMAEKVGITSAAAPPTDNA
jgi:FixJ family two-component response regulator